jgi:osmotically-inducible protein OsmY
LIASVLDYDTKESDMKLKLIAIAIALFLSQASCVRQTMTDATITAAVKSGLASDSATNASMISVDTSGGVVNLSGQVPTTAEKAEAERIARRTSGVRQVINNIAVEQSQPGAGETFSDATILTNIKSQLASAVITGANINVNNGEVTVSGTVENAQEKSRAEEIARQTAGVKLVKNQLVIKRK